MDQTSKRILSIDSLRGFDMMFIAGLTPLIVAICELIPCDFTVWLQEQMVHVKWDGLHHHDTIFPLFLFIAGMSFPFSYAKQKLQNKSNRQIIWKIIKRALILCLLGLIYNGLFRLHFDHLRFASVLGRIGIAWMFAALLFIKCKTVTRIIIAAVILIGYCFVSMLCIAPDAPAGTASLSMDGCIAGYIDRLFLPGRMYRETFDPEGLFSTIPAIVTAMLGNFTGEFLQNSSLKLSDNKKALYILIAGIVFAIIGAVWGIFYPINKSLWSSSFVMAVAGYSLIVYSIFYYIIDVKKHQSWTIFFRVVGMNSITIYMAQSIIDFHKISNFFFGGIIELCPENIAKVIDTAGYFSVIWLFLYFLYKKNIFLKV